MIQWARLSAAPPGMPEAERKSSIGVSPVPRCLWNDSSGSATGSPQSLACKLSIVALGANREYRRDAYATIDSASDLLKAPPARLVFSKCPNSRQPKRDALCTWLQSGGGSFTAEKVLFPMSSYSSQHLAETAEIVQKLDPETLEKMADLLADIRNRGGRLFFLGVGGSAANASHAVNDFRKIAGLECYAPTDNVSELTARTNDEGWASVFVEWLKGSRLQAKDALMIFSVGGGNLEKNVSPNLVSALQYAKEVGSSVLGIVGRDGGYTAKVADACCIVPTVNSQNVTPHSEAFQAVLWHLLVSHPKLKVQQTKWESTR
jgi:D-sedoheptulose 7-phosphate isomerase